MIHSLEASELLVCWALPACRDCYLRVPLDFTFHIAWTDCDLRWHCIVSCACCTGSNRKEVRLSHARGLKVWHLDGRGCRQGVLQSQLRCLVPVEWAGRCFTWEGTWSGRRVQRQLCLCCPGLYWPSGRCLLSKLSPKLPWHYAVRAYESPEGVMKRVVWTSRFRGPGHEATLPPGPLVVQYSAAREKKNLRPGNMNRSPHQSQDYEPAGAGVPPSIPFVRIRWVLDACSLQYWAKFSHKIQF